MTDRLSDIRLGIWRVKLTYIRTNGQKGRKIKQLTKD